MTKESHRFSVFFMQLVLLCLTLFIFPVSAQDEDHYRYAPITKVDLGVTSLELAAGESYTFHVTFEPENNILETLDWYVTDERVIRIDPLANTVTALSDGEARIFAESIDGVSYVVCDVKVGTSSAKDASVMKSGSDFIGLSQRDLSKITAPSLVRYLNFAAESVMDEESFEGLSGRSYDVLAFVRPGSEESESRKAIELGLASEPLRNLQSVTLRGTLKQLLAFIKDNSDLIEVIEIGSTWFDEPDSIPDEGELSSKTVQNKFNLQGRADELSSFTTAHNFGLTGSGRTIAIIDTGFVSSHEQFRDRNGKGRFIKEACFSVTGKISGNDYYSACKDGAIDDGRGASLNLDKVYRKDKFNHGTHVAGVAAGRDGVAPDAHIIGIQAASEMRWTCSESEKKNYRCAPDSDLCCKTRFTSSDQARAFDYLLELAKNGTKIDAVNMSFGSPISSTRGYTEICDSEESFYKRYFDKLNEAGILPVVAAGNDGFNDGVNSPACISNAYTVAALTNHKNPFLASYSDFNKPIIDIAAPGTGIYSSDAVNMDTKTLKITCTKDCYGYMNGTSFSAPMVTGAIALVRQLYPGMSSQDAGKFLKYISEKTVSKRVTADNKFIDYKFDFSKPVLDLRKIAGKLLIPDSAVTTEGQKVKITFIEFDSKADIKIRIQESNKKTWLKNVKYRIYADDNYHSTIEIDGKGNFKEGTLYRVEILRKTAGGQEIKAVKYFMPLPVSRTLSQSLTAVPFNSGAFLNVYLPKDSQNRITYKIYESDTGQLIQSVDPDANNSYKVVFGLVNGQKYYVTAQYYRDVIADKKRVRVCGAESEKVWFIPMNTPSNCTVREKGGSVSVSCTEHPTLDGIAVLYRSADENQFKPAGGIISKKGEFSAEIADPAIRKNTHQFMVMYYKQEKDGSIRPGYGDVETRPYEGKVELADYPLIYSKDKNNIEISVGKENISVLLVDPTSPDIFTEFCESPGASCTGKLSDTNDKLFLIMNYEINEAGKKMYSSAYLASNIWGPK